MLIQAFKTNDVKERHVIINAENLKKLHVIVGQCFPHSVMMGI